MEIDAIHEIKTAISQTSTLFGLSNQVADDLAQCVTAKIMKSIGGSSHYIPKKETLERNEKIKAEFNGKNKAELMKKYAVKKSSFYRIIK